jgi:hypothetical protein
MMSSPATAETEVAPIWGRENDAPTDEPIAAAAVVPTTVVMFGAGAGDKSPATTSGDSGAVAPAAAASPGVEAPPICATYGLCPAARHAPDQPGGTCLDGGRQTAQ